MSDSLSSVWVSSGALCKISDIRIFTSLYCCHNFYPVSTKLLRKHVIGDIQAISFSGDLPNFKSIMSI